jgi:Membrane bound beta barrel domain (DUF5777)
MMWSRALILAVPLAVMAQVPALGQDATAPAGTSEAAAAAQEDDPDLDPNPAQPDFTVVNLPTTLRLPRFKSAFRVTHRFARPLGSGDFSNLLEDFFGFDSGALIGLEYRFGIFRGAQLGIHRTSNRTIEFFGQYDLLGANPDRLVNLAALVTVDGTNNFRDDYTPAFGLLASYQLGDHGAVYVEPMYVNNANLLDPLEDDDVFIVGLGARLRIRPTVYLVGEYTPRVSGYEPGSNLASFGIEKRVGGHAFQINFSNGFGTTMGQIARGSVGDNDWFIGFNISRKFF